MSCPHCHVETPPGAEVCPSCGQALGLLGAVRVGATLAGRYEVQQFLGRGGMGAVYKAHDKALDELVAVKVLLQDVADSPDLAVRFVSEIKLARKIRHKNVCAIHEYGEAGTLRFIVMEFIEGQDLKRILQERGALPPRDAFDVAIQLARGLQAIHEAGVVHRDLKTSNVMLDKSGAVRLMDFGIAKDLAFQGGPAATAVGHILGTPEYMSPEQARGAKIDYRSDLYSLGIVVFEIFTGNVPFHGNTPIATIFKQMEEPLRIEGMSAEMIPVALALVLERALAKRPDDRYANAGELIQALIEARTASFPAATTQPSPIPDLAEDLPTTVVNAHTPPSRPTPRPSPPTPPPTPATVLTQLPTPPGVPTLRGTISPVRTPRPGRQRVEPSPPTPPPLETPTLAAPYETARGARPQRDVLPWLLGFVAVLIVAVAGAVWVARQISGSRETRQEGTPAPSAEPGQPTPPSPTVSAPAAPSPTLPSPTPGATTAGTQAARLHVEPGPPLAPTGTVSRGPVAPSRSTASTPTTLPFVPLKPVPPDEPPPAADADLEPGLLQLRIKPWAEISVDGTIVGTTPLKPLSLSPGEHVVRLTHPDFKPLQRKVTLKPGQTTKLELDLTWEAVPRN